MYIGYTGTDSKWLKTYPPPHPPTLPYVNSQYKKLCITPLILGPNLLPNRKKEQNNKILQLYLIISKILQLYLKFYNNI